MFRDRLRAIAARLEDIEAVVLLGDDGLPVESEVLGEDLDLEMVAAEVTTLIREMGQNHRELDIGSIERFEVATERYKLLIGRIAEGFSLLLVTGPHASVGKARFELRRAPLSLAEDLEF